jgi:hypothetical protein
MKINAIFLPVLLIACSAKTQDKTYIASTPAALVVRIFLDIPITDSVDFIRWNLRFQNDQYMMQCNYGIGKPNTNGFIGNGKKISLNNRFRKEKNYYQLQNGNKILKVIELNTNLLHLLDDDNSLLVGNGGWSYTLNNTKPSIADQLNITATQTALKDSMVFEGRTPCGIPGVVAPGTECYKLKWHVALYANAQENKPGSYKLLGTAWRKDGGRTGNWRIVTRKNGQVVYQLNNDKGNAFIYLLKTDENILLFTDAHGNPLIGNEDFSYTLNRLR